MYLTNSPVVVSYSEKIKMKKSCEFESRSWRSALDTTMSDKVCQWLETGRLFSPGTPISSTNKTDRHDITEILLKVALNTMKQKSKIINGFGLSHECRKHFLYSVIFHLDLILLRKV
jgi:hypothetical protein